MQQLILIYFLQIAVWTFSHAEFKTHFWNTVFWEYHVIFHAFRKCLRLSWQLVYHEMCEHLWYLCYLQLSSRRLEFCIWIWKYLHTLIFAVDHLCLISSLLWHSLQVVLSPYLSSTWFCITRIAQIYMPRYPNNRVNCNGLKSSHITQIFFALSVSCKKSGFSDCFPHRTRSLIFSLLYYIYQISTI